jgi:enoyl-CoA hydratase/carnithine racemase
MSAVASPPEVIVTKENGLGRLTLARSKQLNALGAGAHWQLNTT